MADIQQTGERLTGIIEEPGLRRAVAGMTLTATISDKVSDGAVTLLKAYDQQTGGYDTVNYEGIVSDEGREIWGAWTIR